MSEPCIESPSPAAGPSSLRARRLPRRLSAALAVTAALGGILPLGAEHAAADATPSGPVRTRVSTVRTFDPAAAQTPENLVVTPSAVFVSLAFTSTVVAVSGSGGDPAVGDPVHRRRVHRRAGPRPGPARARGVG